MTAVQERIAVLGGTGALGSALAKRLAAAGLDVVIGSRDAERARLAAEAISSDGRLTGAANADAAGAADVVFLAVPFASQATTLKDVAPALAPGAVLVDATVPLATAIGGRPSRTVAVWQGSAAQAALELVPAGVAVVSALHTVSAAMLDDLSKPLGEDTLMCGDDAEAKARIAAVLELVDGLRVVDVGRLEMARVLEQLTPMLIGVNRRYKTHAGISIARLYPEA